MQLQTFDTAAIENQAMRAYFRRLGKLADQPSQFCTEFFEKDGEQYVRLANINRNLATYRVTRRTDGGWQLRYVEPDSSRPKERSDLDGGDIEADTEQEPGQGTNQSPHGEWSHWRSLLVNLPTVGPIPADKPGASN